MRIIGCANQKLLRLGYSVGAGPFYLNDSDETAVQPPAVAQVGNP